MLKPLGPRVLVKQDEVVVEKILDDRELSAKKAGIVFIDKTEQELKREQMAIVVGTVVSVGDQAFMEPVGNGVHWAVPGDRVYYAKYAGKEVTDPETQVKYLLLNDEDLCCLITGE